MRHRVAGKQLSRNTSHRRAMRRNMAASLFEHEAIRTTPQKATELRKFVERLITIAKKGTLHARRQVLAELNDRALIDEEGFKTDQTVVQKLFSEIAPRYADRPGGYTRIIRLSERRIGDGGKQVLVQLIGAEETTSGATATGASKRQRRATKRHDAAAAVKEAAPVAEAPVEETPAEETPAEETEAGEEKTE